MHNFLGISTLVNGCEVTAIVLEKNARNVYSRANLVVAWEPFVPLLSFLPLLLLLAYGFVDSLLINKPTFLPPLSKGCSKKA